MYTTRVHTCPLYTDPLYTHPIAQQLRRQKPEAALVDDADLERDLLEEWGKASEDNEGDEEDDVEDEGEDGLQEQDLENERIEVYDQNGELVGTYSPAEFELLKAESV